MNEAQQGTALAPSTQSISLVARIAGRYGVDPGKLLTTLKATVFKQEQGNEVTNEQMMALLVVADQYKLNPFTKEIYAFFDKKKGIVPVVGVDGFARIISEHPQCDGFEFRESAEVVESPEHKPCPKWMEVTIYRKDRSHPVVVREYLDEVYRPLGTYPDGNKHKPGPWQTHTKRFLRHKTLIQGGRIALGFTGAFDEDEAQRIIEAGGAAAGATTIEGEVISSTTSNSAADRMREHLGGKVEKEADKPNTEKPSGKPAAPTAAGLDLDIEGAADKGDLGPILDKIMVLKDTPERAGLLQKWNAKSRELSPADDDGVIDNPVAEIKSDVPWEKPVKAEAPKPGPAKPAAKAEPKAAAPAKAPEPEKPAPPIGKTEKPVGTEADAGEFIQSFGAASSPEELDNAADAANAYRWPRKLQGELNTAYMKCSEELQAAK